MRDIIGGGLWIPLLFFVVTIFYAVWVLYRNLDRLRDRGRRIDQGLEDVLFEYRVAMERIKQAESLIGTEETDRAIHELQGILKTYPALSAADYFLGKAYQIKGDTSRAREHLQRFLDNTRPYDMISRERMEEAQRCLKGMG